MKFVEVAKNFPGLWFFEPHDNVGNSMVMITQQKANQLALQPAVSSGYYKQKEAPHSAMLPAHEILRAPFACN